MALTENQKTKLMLIESFIEWYWSDDQERAKAKEQAAVYVTEDHVDEVGVLNGMQKKVIIHAYLDLLGSLMSPLEHNYEGQKETLAEMEQLFPFIK